MKTYPIPMVPGPVKVPDEVLAAYRESYGSGDLEPEFLALYNQTEKNLQKLFETNNSVVIQTGEGMLALWGALKSCLHPGDRVLCVGTGVFGFGIADMANSIGAVTRTIAYGYDETIKDLNRIEHIIEEFQPKMITAVHCETPSGTLNPLEELGQLKEKYGIPLLYVDTVASLGGAPVQVDERHIDLCLGGSQKVLSVPPNMAFLSVSERAWEIIEEVNYPGYDALKPFHHAQDNFYFPYTPDWHGMAALNTGAELILKEGLENSFQRHAQAAAFCRDGLTALGISVFPKPDAIPAPTVTAARVPEKFTWQDFDRDLREHGLVVGGSYGPLTGKVFRLGHMGTQANIELIQQAMDVLEKVIKKI
jgi:aspartate aminotransferase-like enzyme